MLATMNNVHEQHRDSAPRSSCCAVITVSDTRTRETDAGGNVVIKLLLENHHRVACREIIPDDPHQMRPLLEKLSQDSEIDAILLTGGTGISRRDQTYETVLGLMTKPLPGYGELFRMLSFQQIGPAAMLSRAVGGLMGSTVVLTMPGSPSAVELAMRQVILPELGHLIREARR